MSLLSDTEITHLCQHHAMIAPFSPISRTDIAPGLVGPSYGLSSTGYDIRLSDKWSRVKDDFASGYYPPDYVYQTSRKANVASDPNSSIDMMDTVSENYLLQPGSFVLAVSHEKFTMPPDVMGICTGKSTLARMGLIVLVTPLEAGWEGYLTLELFNAGPLPIDLKAGIGICQINFFKANEVPHKSYMNRSGKYMHQKDAPVAARLG